MHLCRPFFSVAWLYRYKKKNAGTFWDLPEIAHIFIWLYFSPRTLNHTPLLRNVMYGKVSHLFISKGISPTLNIYCAVECSIFTSLVWRCVVQTRTRYLTDSKLVILIILLPWSFDITGQRNTFTLQNF